jgi:hypothetical protein
MTWEDLLKKYQKEYDMSFYINTDFGNLCFVDTGDLWIYIDEYDEEYKIADNLTVEQMDMLIQVFRKDIL